MILDAFLKTWLSVTAYNKSASMMWCMNGIKGQINMKSMLMILLLCFNFLSPVWASNLTEEQITALLEGDLKIASEVLEKEIDAYPNEPMFYGIAGDVYAVRAQGASIFAAPALAKKILKSYKQAVALEPSNTDYRMRLMQFYLFAPSLVGGSKKLAKQQATEVKRLNVVTGVLAESLVLLDNKDKNGLTQLFANLTPELSAHPQIQMAQANYLINMDQQDQAATLLKELVNLPIESLPEDYKLLPYKAMLQTGFLGTKNKAYQAAGIQALQRYLKIAPVTYKLTSKKWVRLFLGELYASSGQEDKAKATLLGVRADATDKNLIKQLDKALKKLD